MWHTSLACCGLAQLFKALPGRVWLFMWLLRVSNRYQLYKKMNWTLEVGFHYGMIHSDSPPFSAWTLCWTRLVVRYWETSTASLGSYVNDYFMSVLAFPSHAMLVRRKMQMVNCMTVCISLGGMLDTTDLSVPSGVGSSPVGKSSQRDSLALCSCGSCVQ